MLKLLVVDDNEMMRKGIEWYFEPKGYTVYTAGSAEEALPMIKTQAPDVLLLDMNMPGMTGIELLTEVRQFNKTVKAIMISGEILKLKDDPQIKPLEISAFLDKPVDFSELESFIQKITELSGKE